MRKEAHGCGNCRDEDRTCLIQLGEPERAEFFGGKAHEVRTRFQCKKCGARWILIVESGLGGHGHCWNPEP